MFDDAPGGHRCATSIDRTPPHGRVETVEASGGWHPHSLARAAAVRRPFPISRYGGR